MATFEMLFKVEETKTLHSLGLVCKMVFLVSLVGLGKWDAYSKLPILYFEIVKPLSILCCNVPRMRCVSEVPPSVTGKGS